MNYTSHIKKYLRYRDNILENPYFGILAVFDNNHNVYEVCPFISKRLNKNTIDYYVLIKDDNILINGSFKLTSNIALYSMFCITDSIEGFKCDYNINAFSNPYSAKLIYTMIKNGIWLTKNTLIPRIIRIKGIKIDNNVIPYKSY